MGLVRRFCAGGFGQVTVRLSLVFCIFTPFDTVRGSDAKVEYVRVVELDI